MLGQQNESNTFDARIKRETHTGAVIAIRELAQFQSLCLKNTAT